MKPLPTVRASTTKRARDDEEFDKSTGVRGIDSGAGDILKSAIAATMAPMEGNMSQLQALKDKLGSKERGNRTRSR